MEAWHINSAHAPLNRDDGGLLPDAYLHLVRKKAANLRVIAVRQLDAEQADTVRRAVNGILQQAEPLMPNITKEMRDALKNLKEDESSMVLPTDNIMDTDTYRAKMFTLIENGPYQLLNKDPTDRLTRKLSEKLLTLKRSGYLSEAVYNKIRPRHKQPPRIYGLPKIHKADVPLRPIVSILIPEIYIPNPYP